MEIALRRPQSHSASGPLPNQQSGLGRGSWKKVSRRFRTKCQTKRWGPPHLIAFLLD